MKTLFKVIFVNIIFIIFVFFTAEFLSIILNYNMEKIDKETHYKLDKEVNSECNRNKKYSFIEHFIDQKIKFQPTKEYIFDYGFRKPALVNKSSKKGVLLLGCSFAYGQFLDDKEAFHSILSKQTNRSVYNLGIAGGSPRETLYMLRNSDDLEKLIQNKNIEYVIYTYIPDQERRLYTNIRDIVPSFKKTQDNNSLEYFPVKKLINTSYLYRNWTNFYYKYFISKEESFDLFCLYMKEINKEIKKLFGQNTKFIILIYPDYEPRNMNEWKKLNQDNIRVLNITQKLDIIENKNQYAIENDDHPNAKAWQVIVPVLAKELNL